jgi:hypothetical protein
VARGWFFILDATQGESNPTSVVLSVDFGRLSLLGGAVVLTGGLAAYAIGRRPRASETTRRVILWTGSTALAGIALYTTAHFIEMIQTAIARHNAEIARGAAIEKQAEDPRLLFATLPDVPTVRQVFLAMRTARTTGNSETAVYDGIAQRFKGFLPVKELGGLGYKMSEGDGVKLVDFVNAMGEAALRVHSIDLKKITLFDVTFSSLRDMPGGSFEGRIRNDLRRSVKNVVIRGSFYNVSGDLIEVRTFPLGGSYQPGAPQSFSSGFSGVGKLPKDYRWVAEVAEASFDQLE